MSRSYLYVPGDRGDRLAKAADRGADSLILDLEDSVAPSRKAAARAIVQNFLVSDAPAAQYWVRVNCDENLSEDVAAVAVLPIAGIYFPKASTESLARLDVALAESPGTESLAVVALIETALGVVEVAKVATSRRVVQLAIGEADLAAELGIAADAPPDALWPLRMQLVVASAAAGIHPPTGPVSTQWQDLDELRRETAELAAAGFGSRAAIHPAQVPVINDVFTPTPEAVAVAEQLVAEFEAALDAGTGVIVGPDATMVDEAVVAAARRVIDIANRNS
jgi:citrate lyase subunit beta/citryl-CoA lyase